MKERTMRSLSLATVLALSVSAPAFAADTPASTGLAGTTWALDCKQPPSSTNYYLVYSISSDGRLVETLKSTGEEKNRKLRNLQAMGKGWLLYTMDDNDGEAVNIVTFTDSKGRKKTWWSVGNNGKAYVVNGQFPESTGGPPWFSQCK
jgi:hypothetical protein